MRVANGLTARTRSFVDAQVVLLLAIMAWPILYLAKQDQDVFSWPSLVQYALVGSLVLLARRQAGWRALQSGRERTIWLLFWVLALYLTIATLVHSPIFLDGVAGFVKHMQFLPLLLVAGAVGIRADLWQRWYRPYLMAAVSILALPALLAAIGSDSALLASACQYVGFACPGTGARYDFGFGNPNQLAVFLVSAMVMTLFMGLSDLKRPRFVLPASAAACLGAYAVTRTYSGRVWLILPLALLLGGALQRGLRRRLWFAVGLGASVVIGVLYLVTRDPATAGGLAVFTPTGVARQLAGLQVRLAFWTRVVSYMDSPAKLLFGIGAGTLGHAMRTYLDSGYRTVDGYYAVLLGEYGLLGLALYLALVIAVLRHVLRAILSRTLAPPDEQTATAMVVGGVVVLLAGLIGNVNTSFPLGLNLWCFLGAGMALSRASSPLGTPASV